LHGQRTIIESMTTRDQDVEQPLRALFNASASTASNGVLVKNRERLSRACQRSVTIAGQPGGDGNPVFFIAEIGVNHNGDVALAKRLIDAAAAVGCETLWGTDHKASLDPNELGELVRAIRDVEAALGDGVKRRYPSELAALGKSRHVPGNPASAG
jgi:hypothetical protein